MPDNMSLDLRQMTSREFAALGIEYVAYVKPIDVDGRAAFAVHAANGRQVAVVDTREVAMATVRQNDLEPLSVH